MLKLQIKIKLRYAYSVKRNVCHNYFCDVVFNITIVLYTVKLKHIIFYLHELVGFNSLRKKGLFGEVSKLKRLV